MGGCRRVGVVMRTRPPTRSASDDVTGTEPRGGRHRTVGLVALGVLVVALHVVLGTAVVAAPRWTGPALDVVLAAVVVKLLVSVVLGRRVVRHRRRSATAPTAERPRP